jgi:hypothetical protein
MISAPGLLQLNFLPSPEDKVHCFPLGLLADQPGAMGVSPDHFA